MILKKEEILSKNANEIKDSIFIYPTDSIYGIGCDATNSSLIAKLRLIKNRNEKPFSIIAPSITWVKNNFFLNEKEREIISHFKNCIELDGEKRPFTILLKPINKDLMPDNLTNGLKRIGIRIPKHWVSDLVEKIGFPIVTTSVNETGTANMKSLVDLDKKIEEKVDFIVDEGTLDNKPSVIILVKENNDVEYLKR